MRNSWSSEWKLRLINFQQVKIYINNKRRTMSDSGDEENVSYPPWNFSWVVKGELAAMAWPQTESNLRFLVDQGIQHLITLSPEKLPPIDAIHAVRHLNWTEIKISEFEPPTLAQVKKFIDICQRCNLLNQAVGIHCRMGRGRCGVMAACYLVHFHEQAPERAIINVRLMRPGSVETPEQERAVIRYHDCLRGTR